MFMYFTPISLPIVGVTFGKRQKLLATLDNGEPLFFKPEPGNTYDPKALALVTISGDHVGYIGRNCPMRDDLLSFINDKEGMLVARLAHLRGGYSGKNLGADVEFYAIPADFFDRHMVVKDEEEVIAVSKSKGKHPTNRYDLDRKYKDKDRARKWMRSTKSPHDWNIVRRELSKEDVCFKSMYTKELRKASKCWHWKQFHSIELAADLARAQRREIEWSEARW